MSRLKYEPCAKSPLLFYYFFMISYICPNKQQFLSIEIFLLTCLSTHIVGCGKCQFSDETFDLFLVFPRGTNWDCSLEPPRFLASLRCLCFGAGTKKMLTPRGCQLYGSVTMKNGKTMIIPSCELGLICQLDYC